MIRNLEVGKKVHYYDLERFSLQVSFKNRLYNFMNPLVGKEGGEFVKEERIVFQLILVFKTVPLRIYILCNFQIYVYYVYLTLIIV